MPILYNPLAFGEKSLQKSWKVFVCRYLPTNKLAFLCVLCDSAVKAGQTSPKQTTELLISKY
jgi:hypothetical protein